FLFFFVLFFFFFLIYFLFVFWVVVFWFVFRCFFYLIIIIFKKDAGWRYGLRFLVYVFFVGGRGGVGGGGALSPHQAPFTRFSALR
ncbi:hypothetical protein ACVGWU_04710, partial [Enterobacter intestinihominis]